MLVRKKNRDKLLKTNLGMLIVLAEEKGFKSVKEFSDATGIDYPSLSSLLKSKSVPKEETIAKLKKGLKGLPKLGVRLKSWVNAIVISKTRNSVKKSGKKRRKKKVKIVPIAPSPAPPETLFMGARKVSLMLVSGEITVKGIELFGYVNKLYHPFKPVDDAQTIEMLLKFSEK